MTSHSKIDTPTLETLEDWEEWNPESSSFFTHAFAGSLAGAAEHCLIFPIDTIKTFSQQNSGSASLKQMLSRPTCEKSPFPFQNPGTRLWRGVSSMLTACVPAHAIYFSVYEKGKAMNKNNNALFSAATGMCATVGHDLIMCPMDLIKQRMQLGFHSGILDAARSVLRSEGFGTFYLAFPTTLVMNLPYAGISVAVNDTVKNKLNPRGEYNVPAFITAGGIAGATAALFTNPLDVIKTRIQTQNLLSEQTEVKLKVPNVDLQKEKSWNLDIRRNPAFPGMFRNRKVGANYRFGQISHSAAFMVKSSTGTTTFAKTNCLCEDSVVHQRKYRGLADAVQKIFREEGVRGFARGSLARVLVHTPSVAISWTTYESAKRILMG
eukprot:snap_masked-scaffold_62-processed-gene-0.22-mRNA-1 protein AED:0.22 eAED:0.22 QI:0/-1/0/1/-1/1/1/0/378